MAHQDRDGGRGHAYGSNAPHGGLAQGGAFVPGGHSRGGGRGRGRGGGGRQGRVDWGPPRVYTPGNGIIPVPDGNVGRFEDARQVARQSPSYAMSTLSVRDNTMPARPGYGTEGTPIIVYANYLPLTLKSDLVLYMYDMSKIKPIAGGKKLTQIIRLMFHESNELAQSQNDIITDFKSTLISRKRFPLKGDKHFINVTYKAEDEDNSSAGAQVYEIPIVLTKILTVGELMAYLTSTNPATQYNSKLEMIQGLNIFFNHYSKSNNRLATIGSSKTFAWGANDHNSLDLGQGLMAIRGFFASVRMATSRILVNVNVSHGAFYQEGRLTNLISAFLAQPSRKATPPELNRFVEFLRVRTTHLKEKINRHGKVIKRQKSIVGLAKPYKPKKNTAQLPKPPLVDHLGAGPKNVKFWLRERANDSNMPFGPEPTGSGPGRYVSVYDYFKNTYGIEMDQRISVVNVGSEHNPSYLPAEVCIVLPGQSARTMLNSKQSSSMVSFAVRPPWVNAKSIETDGLKTAGLSNITNPLLDQFGVTVDQSLITVPARILKAPFVQYRKKPVRVENGSWNMRDIQFNKPGKLKRWSFLAIREARDSSPFGLDEIRTAVEGFTHALRSNGVDLAGQAYSAGRDIVMQDATDPAMDGMFEKASERFDLLLIILPGQEKTNAFNSKVYSYIKLLGDTKYGIHTVCVIGDKFKNNNPQYFGNVGLKFNLKLGGNNQAVESSHLSFITEDKTMLVGLDVTHPSPGSSSTAPSVAGMVASIDKRLGQWPATLRMQNSKQEMVNEVGDMLMTHLDYWKTLGKHTSFPENIIVYRDGVSEGQYNDVLEIELSLLRQACKEKYPPGKEPRLAIIIVGKRHHTRFYPVQERDMDTVKDKNGNPRGSSNLKSGTVVDRGVTEEGMWDFFLQAHNVLQGTGRPAHYVVVLDEIFRARKGGRNNVANEVEKLTHALCFTYGRATKAVSICTPAYYADILCERARRYNADLFDGFSDTASTLSSALGQSLEGSVKVHERLRTTMFYI